MNSNPLSPKGRSRSSLLRKPLLSLAAASAGLLLLSSCAAGPADNDGGEEPQELTDVKLVLGFIAGPNFAAPFAALEEGFFEEEGLNVEIMQGGPSVEGESLVATGQADFVFGGLPDVPGAVQEGLPLKAVLVTNALTEFGLVLDADSGIEKPSDLEGKTVALSQFATPTTLFEPFLAINDVDASKINVVSAAGPAIVAALLSDQADAAGGGGGTFVQVQEKLPEAGFMSYADWGVDVLGAGIVTSTDLIDSDPELVRSFVKAFVRGLEFTVNNPQAAIDYEAKYFPDALNAYQDPAAALKFVTDLTEEPYGYMEPELWESTVSLLAEFGLLEDGSNPEQYYTNEFLPSE